MNQLEKEVKNELEKQHICYECGKQLDTVFRWYSCPSCNYNNITNKQLLHMKKLVDNSNFLELFQWIKE